MVRDCIDQMEYLFYYCISAQRTHGMCGVSSVREEPGACKSWCFLCKILSSVFLATLPGGHFIRLPYTQISLGIWICFILKSGKAWLDSLLKSYKVKVKMSTGLGSYLEDLGIIHLQAHLGWSLTESHSFLL